MTQKPLDPAKTQSILRNVREGMEIHDNQEHKVGTVKEVYFGADSDEMMKHGAGAATAPDPNLRDNTFMDDIARGLNGGDNLPEEVRQRLINEGFLRISGGLLSSDHFVLPDQISGVHGDHVHLNVAVKDLLKA